MNHILLRDALHEMDQVSSSGIPVPFSLKFVTADRKRKTGGEIIEVKDAIKCIGKKNGMVIYDGNTLSRKEKAPSHYENATRNIALPNGSIRKIHIRLIIEFNAQKVIY